MSVSVQREYIQQITGYSYSYTVTKSIPYQVVKECVEAAMGEKGFSKIDAIRNLKEKNPELDIPNAKQIVDIFLNGV